MKTTLVLLSLIALLSACETTQGFGRDLQKAGNDIQGVAARATP